MKSEKIHKSIEPLVHTFIQELFKNYWSPIHSYIRENPELIKVTPGFLINPEKVVVYIGRTHIALEYIGSEVASELKSFSDLQVVYHDYSTKDCNLFEKIIGFEYDSTIDWNMPLPSFSDDLLLPTNRGWDMLCELGWNFSAQNAFMGFNTPSPVPQKGDFARVVNGLFFDAGETGLKSRHIKWLDFFPIDFDGSDEETDSISFSVENMKRLVEHDATYRYPMSDDYKYIKLPKINRFIEIWGNTENTEVDITSHISKEENKFILTMRFGAKQVHPELTCEWQSEDRKDIRPDFFIEQPNGYADIVEFKLPNLSKNFIVGKNNRESFASWLNSYISQTRVYATYFEDPNNRTWFEKKYGFKVHKPRRWLVIGRRDDFDSDIWREIVADYQGLEIMTYDDLIDGVVVQFYK